MNISIVSVISSSIVSLVRTIKFRRFGLSDIQETEEIGPANTDSVPIKGMVAIYADTSSQGQPVIIGYINKNQLAEPGEHRIYSTDSNGTVKTFIWLKSDGKIQLGGNADNGVRWSPLDQFTSELNQFLTIEMAKIAAGIATGGGSYTPGTANFNVNDAKINEILTP